MLLNHAAPIVLEPIATTALDRHAVFAEAAMVFAAVLGKPTVQRPLIALADPRFERVLYLHMAALASVEGIAFDAGTLMDVILDHEQRFWQTEATTRQQTAVNVPLARQLVTDQRASRHRCTAQHREASDERLLVITGREDAFDPEIAGRRASSLACRGDPQDHGLAEQIGLEAGQVAWLASTAVDVAEYRDHHIIVAAAWPPCESLADILRIFLAEDPAAKRRRSGNPGG